jgi:hypothetical protein
MPVLHVDLSDPGDVQVGIDILTHYQTNVAQAPQTRLPAATQRPWQPQ